MFLSNSLIDGHCLGITLLVSSFAGYHVSTKTNCDSKRSCRLRVPSISWQVQERKPSLAPTGKIHINGHCECPDTMPWNCNWGLSALPSLDQAIKAIAFKLQEAGNCFMQKDLKSIMQLKVILDSSITLLLWGVGAHGLWQDRWDRKSVV